MKKMWLFGFYFIFFTGVASYSPYLVLYYQSLSFTGAQIGLIVGITPLITVVSLPLMTGIADRTNRHKLIMSLCLLVVVFTLLIYPNAQSFVLLFGLAILSAIFFAPIMPFSASASMFMLGDKKELFSRIRMGGTIGFSLASMVMGVFIENHGLKIAFLGAAVLFFIAFLFSQKMVYTEDIEQNVDKGQASQLLKNPYFLLFLLLGLSGGISGKTLSTYLFPYMKELGAGESMMGFALTIGTLVEIPVLFFVSSFIRRFNVYSIVIFSIVMIGVRFLLLAVASNAMVVLLIQLLNGFNHPLLTVAGAMYTDDQAPTQFRATAQGLFNVASGGIGSAVGGFVGGLLFDNVGAKGMYLVFGVLMFLVLAFVTVVRRMLPPEPEKVEFAHSP